MPQGTHNSPHSLIFTPATGKCASCRYLSSGVTFYPVGPPAVSFTCAKGHRNKVGSLAACHDYEREPGAD